MLDACKQAKYSIDFEQYIFEPGEIGNQFIAVLITKAQQGVAVRLLCDAVGSYTLSTSNNLTELTQAGVQVRFFNKIHPLRLHTIFSWFFRTHRKILVTDNEICFSGGVGIHDDFKGWRDTHASVRGEVAREVQRSFNELWLQSSDMNIFSRIRRVRKRTKGTSFITNAPYIGKHFLYKEYLSALRKSQRYAYFTTAYFIPSNAFIDALIKAAKRGVDVKIIIPKASDIPSINKASRYGLSKLIRNGVQIYLYTGGMIHTKTAAIDNVWATLGSSNLDNLSFRFNYESNFVSQDPFFISTINQHFIDDLKVSHHLSLEELRQRPLIDRVLELVLYPLRPIL